MATTNLKFTLTSPGSDDPVPTPTPTPTPTPSDTTTTTTVVGSPNTGDNTTSDNVGGSVFATLFILIGLAALAVFLVKYLKKNRRLSFAEKGSFHLSLRPRVFATVGLVLAVAFLGSSILVNSYNQNEKRADAAATELGISVKSDMTFEVDRSKSAYLTDAVIVTTGGNGYTLEVSTDNSKFCRENDTTNCLSSTSGDITSENTSNLSSLGTNEWGMSLLGSDAAASIWGAVPTTAKVIKDRPTTVAEADATTVYYGVNLGSNLPDGTYYGKVIYTAYAKDVPTGDYQVTTVNGYVNASGTKTNDRFDAEDIVVIRENCPADSTFLGWTSTDINPNIIDGPDSDGYFYFTMPAKNVTVTAICDDEISEDLVIVYNANAPSGTTATGSTANTPVPADADKVNLRANGFTIPGYTFAGWACSKSATTKDYSGGQSNVDVDALILNCGIDLTQDVPTITLYAIWTINEPTYLQDVTPEYCNNMTIFSVKTLPDRRDNKNYSFTKYADGRCWMLSDLDYRPATGTAVTLTTTDTDVSTNRSVTFATSGTSGALYHTQSGYSTLYNYNAATAGYWSSWSSKAANKVVPDSLCPANWKIPDASHGPTFHEDTQTITNDTTYGTNSGELYGLWNYNAGKGYGYGKTASDTWKRSFMFSSGTFTTSTGNKTVTYPHFTYNGAWSFSSNNWADTTKGTSGKYASYFLSTTTTDSGSVVPAAFNPHAPGVDSDTADINVTDPAHGSSVRCLLRNADEITNRGNAGGAYDITD